MSPVSDSPRVSLLMTVHNGEAYIEQAILSLLKQSFEDFELLLVDDASTDSSLAQARELADARFVFLGGEQRLGRVRALNLGLKQARGEYLAVLDADDRCAPERLAIQVAFLEANPKVSLVGSAFDFIGQGSEHLSRFTPPNRHEDLLAAFPLYNPIAHSSVMYRLNDALKAGGYPEDYPYAHDLALYLKFVELGLGLAVLPEALCEIRVHPSQMSQSAALRLDLLYDCLRLNTKACALPGVRGNLLAQGRQKTLGFAKEYLQRLRQGGLPARHWLRFGLWALTDPLAWLPLKS